MKDKTINGYMDLSFTHRTRLDKELEKINNIPVEVENDPSTIKVRRVMLIYNNADKPLTEEIVRENIYVPDDTLCYPLYWPMVDGVKTFLWFNEKPIFSGFTFNDRRDAMSMLHRATNAELHNVQRKKGMPVA